MGSAALPWIAGGSVGLNLLGQSQARNDAKSARRAAQSQFEQQMAFQREQLGLSQANIEAARLYDEKRRAEEANAINSFVEDVLNGTFAGGFNGTDVFGGNVDPSLYSPTSIAQGQRDGLGINLVNLDAIQDLVYGANAASDQDFLNRAQRFIPKYASTSNNLGLAAEALSAGVLPFDDALNVVSDRNNFAGQIGVPGNATNTTLADLGLSRLDAMNQGQSMFANMVNMASQISPVSARTTPGSLLFDPSVGLDARINAANAAVAPNPVAQGVADAYFQSALGTQGSFIPPNLPAMPPLNTQLPQVPSMDFGSALMQGLQAYMMGGGTFGGGGYKAPNPTMAYTQPVQNWGTYQPFPSQGFGNPSGGFGNPVDGMFGPTQVA